MSLSTISKSGFAYHPTHTSSSVTLPNILQTILPPQIIQAIGVAWQSINPPPYHTLEEIRLRVGKCSSLTIGGDNHMLPLVMTREELFRVLTDMCGGSLYAFSDTIHQGYITLSGGVRVGVIGQASCEVGHVVGVREISSLCIRIPTSARNVGGEICQLFWQMRGMGGAPRGILLYSPPGVGKTTLLKGIITKLSGGDKPLRTLVIDTRGELTFDHPNGLCLDVLVGYPRTLGVSIATRCMGAQVIVCDEIGDASEALALLSAYHGGVPLIATAHGGCVRELLLRQGIARLHHAQIFGAYVGISRDGRGGFCYHIQKREDIGLDL